MNIIRLTSYMLKLAVVLAKREYKQKRETEKEKEREKYVISFYIIVLSQRALKNFVLISSLAALLSLLLKMAYGLTVDCAL